MAFSMQERIPVDVYGCVQGMLATFNNPVYKDRHQEIISWAVEASKKILNKYQAPECKSLGEQCWFLCEYLQWILEKIEGVKRYNLPSILLQLRVLVKTLSPEEESPQGKKDELQKLQTQIDKLRKSLDEERVAKDELIQRLSIVAADRMKTGNPEIADLSDANRPMKLAEKFNELYSNAWSDAYERLQKTENNVSSNSSLENSIQKSYRKPDSKTDDEDTTRILFQALKSCYEWSQKAADCQKRAIIKAGMGNIDFLTDLTSSSVGNQGPCNSEKSPGQVNPQSLKGGKQDEGTAIIKGGQPMSKSLWVGNQGSGSTEKSPGQVNPQSLKGGNQNEGTSNIKAGQPMSKSLWVGNQGPGSTEKSPGQVNPLNPMGGNQRHGHSIIAPEEETPQAEDQAGANHADEAKVKDEETKSSTLDNYAKEFMRCAGVESSKRLPEKICRKVMEDRKYQDIEVYIQECAELCWLMRIQFPPIELLFDIKPNDKFDHTYHRSYTTSGDKIAFPVWPTMLIHKDGHVLAPGVVQCMKK